MGGGEEVIKEATCTEDGEVVYTCSCGEKKTVVVKKLGHDIQETITEPTYLKQGRIDYQCSRCKATDLKKSVILARVDGSGLGGEIRYKRSSTDMYEAYVILPNNELMAYNGDFTTPPATENDPFVVYCNKASYTIKEVVAEDGTSDYFVSVMGNNFPITEDGDNLIIESPYLPEGENQIKLSPDYHIHSCDDDDITYFLNQGDPISDRYDPCYSYDCNDDNCSFKIGEDEYKVRVVVLHDEFNGICPNCGGVY